MTTIEKGTKQNPDSLSEACEYFSDLSGIPTTKTIHLHIHELYKKVETNGRQKNKLLYPAESITVIEVESLLSSSGKKHPYMLDNMRYDQRGIEANVATVVVNVPIYDFGIKFDRVGNYQDWEGDGYYTCGLYKFGNYYFYM